MPRSSHWPSRPLARIAPVPKRRFEPRVRAQSGTRCRARARRSRVARPRRVFDLRRPRGFAGHAVLHRARSRDSNGASLGSRRARAGGSEEPCAGGSGSRVFSASARRRCRPRAGQRRAARGGRPVSWPLLGEHVPRGSSSRSPPGSVGARAVGRSRTGTPISCCAPARRCLLQSLTNRRGSLRR